MSVPGPGSVSVGSKLPPAVRQTSTVQVFRYSAATWNTHRIHYDQAYAAAEGYPGVLVQSHLHGAFLAQYCIDWAGPDARLLALALRVRRYAVAGEQLTIVGVVTAARAGEPGRAVLDLELTETRGSDGEVCAPATASIEVPASWLAQ